MDERKKVSITVSGKKADRTEGKTTNRHCNTVQGFMLNTEHACLVIPHKRQHFITAGLIPDSSLERKENL